MIKVLALSNSRTGNGGFLETAKPLISQFAGQGKKKMAFIPFASVTRDYITYASMVNDALADLNYQVDVVLPDNAVSSILHADIIMVGGGNTFKLLHDLYDLNLMQLIREKVQGGCPYIGWSAGANIAGATIGTTNDMPIIQPKSFDAFGFLPFQINPHYYNLKMEGHNGETRDQRIAEYVIQNPGVAVVALPEGTALKLEQGKLIYLGHNTGVLFTNDMDEIIRTELKEGDELSYLM
ncbi:MAG: dipeptidase PepE [Bacteroidetes bacterium]|nr:dipeptidase PepE [Bacteroidota bacterium]